MKLALISDTHFGDPDCTLFVRDKTNKLVPGPKYQQFLQATGTNNDYLVLLGDIMDFAIRSYDEAYEIAREFFFQIQRDRIADQIIYIPGNHDEDIWHTVEQEVNIMDRISNSEIPQKFKMSLAGVIDDRTSSNKARLILPGVDETQIDGKLGYGGLFLDKITGKGAKQTRFNFVYPNLYVVSDSGSVLITHGHYFESYWSFLSEWVPDMLGKNLPVTMPMTLQEIVSINFPLNQLSCSGVGQAGKLTDVIRQGEIDVRNHRLASIKQYLDNLDNKLDALVDYAWYDPRKYGWNLVMSWAKSKVLDSLGSMEDARYDKVFMEKADVQDRFKRFYEGSCKEITQLNDEYGYNLPVPEIVIFGHTHQPIPWNSETMHITVANGKTIRLFNSGGWLTNILENGNTEFCGAEVFTYQSGTGFSSKGIR